MLKTIIAVSAMLWLASVAAWAEGLQRVDLAQLPLNGLNLQGGSFYASFLEAKAPFKSQLLIECRSCNLPTDALVGLVADSTGDGADFDADPNAFLEELTAVCQSRAEACSFSASMAGGLPGYAYLAEFADGIVVVEHIYFSNGLQFVINASGPSMDAAKANVAELIRVAGPFVTGQGK